MKNKYIKKCLAPFVLEEISEEIGLNLTDVVEVSKEKFMGKINAIGVAPNRKFQLEFKKFHDLRYGNVLPNFIESYYAAQIRRKEMKNIPLVLIVRVGKLSDSFLGNVQQFLSQYKIRDFNWLMIDDEGRIVGFFEGRFFDQRLRGGDKRSLKIKQSVHKQKLSFSPVQQWLLKCLLLNGIGPDDKNVFHGDYWPLGSNQKLHDYKVLSQISGVGKSSCFNLIKLLEERGYLIIDDYEYKFRNLGRLFSMWEAHHLSERKDEIYLSPIKPMESIDSWREKAFDLFQDMTGNRAILSGHLGCLEIGLSWSNNWSAIFYLHAQNDDKLKRFMKGMRLRPADNAEDGIRVILQKSRFPVLQLADENRRMQVADPIQLMLDVLYLGGRGKEQSDYIYNKLLKGHFERQAWSN